MIAAPRDLFQLQGIDQSHFNQLTDGKPWQEAEDETLLKVMYRLRGSFRLMDLERWCQGEPVAGDLAKNPDASRGEVFRLAGRVTSLETIRPAPEIAQRFEMGEYYRCGFELADGQPALLFAPKVPNAWKTNRPNGAPAGALAVFLKLAGDAPGRPLPAFAAARVAWYPPSKLGQFGFDWGLFDDLRPDEPAGPADRAKGAPHASIKDLQLTERNRECFYQMLAAAARTKPGELLAHAEEELRRSGKDRFSVVPLFNQPHTQRGRLVVLSGTARQVVPIRVSDEDVLRRFGIDRYYQVFLFTDDSQQNPLVFCVREVPPGMPTGEGPHFAEYVTVAGFFFNTWAYRNRQSGAAATAREEWQLAPLLIGRDLRWSPRQEAASNPYFGAVAGGLFVLALGGVWLALWRYHRGDRQFYQQTLAPRIAPESGSGLDAIGLEAEGIRNTDGPAEAGSGPPTPP